MKHTLPLCLCVILSLTVAVRPAASNSAVIESQEFEKSQNGREISPAATGRKFTTSDSGPALPLFLPPPVLYNTKGFVPASMAIGDVNGDGRPDLVVAHLCSFGDYDCLDSATVGVLLGNGDGTFQPVVTYSTGAQGAVSIMIADVNGDHKPDLIVANCITVSGQACFPQTDSMVSVLLGNGDGTFQPAVLYDTGGLDASSVAVADLNRDGKPDIVVTSLACEYCAEGQVDVLLGNGDGTFGSAATYGSGGLNPTSVVIRDVNLDGTLDMLVANNSECDNCAAGVGVLLGNGDGTFQSAVSYSSGGNGGEPSVEVADVNSDGKPDLLAANDECTPACTARVAVLLGNGDGTFQAAANYEAGGCCSVSMAVADLNADGKLDVALVLFNATVAILLGNGHGAFQPTMPSNISEGDYAAGPIVIGDLDRNSMPDLVTAGTINAGAESAVSVLLHVGTKITMTTLASSLNPSVFGQAVTFTASVSSRAGQPTGEVIVYTGSSAIGSATLSNGTASITPPILAAGSNPLTAVYQGSQKFKPSEGQLQQVVNRATTTSALVSSLNPAPVTSLVIYTATVTSQYGGAVSGNVAFYDGASIIATEPVGGSGEATYSTRYKTVGMHSISAVYLGDENNNGSTSATLTENVVAGTRTALTTSGSPSKVGQPVTFTAIVTSRYGSIPDGELVKFYDGNNLMGSVPLAGGTAALTTLSLSVGTHTIKAAYVGDALFEKSTGKVDQEVDP